MLADIGRAGEADLADHLAGDERVADQLRIAMDKLGHALGNAGVGECSEQLGSDARSFMRRSRNDGAARGERSADLLREQIEREVPRRERRGRADGLPDDPRNLSGRSNQRAPIVALGFLGIPVEQLGGSENFRLRLGEDLALLLGHGRCDQVDSLAEELRRFVQDRAAFLDVGRAPFGPGPRGGFERLVQIGLGRIRDLGDRSRIDRIEDGMSVAAFAGFPDAIDEELEVGFVSHGAPCTLALMRLQRAASRY